LADSSEILLSKSDYLLFLEAPRHLWAKRHGACQEVLSDFDRYLIAQGGEVERLAATYVEEYVLPAQPGAKLLWQQTFIDGEYLARPDLLLYHPGCEAYDLVEIKSGTSIDKENLHDITFQYLVLAKTLPIQSCALLHLNKDYRMGEALELEGLFLWEDVTDQVRALAEDVRTLRAAALRTVQTTDPEELDACASPRACPCPEVCFPDLPGGSIYELPRLFATQKQALRRQGILRVRDLPEAYKLNKKQRIVAECVRAGREHLDRAELRERLDKLRYPLWFLDYETCLCPIPIFPGYKPQQPAVFQYSLHRQDAPGGEVQQCGFIGWGEDEPSGELLEHLSAELGAEGSVLVWNQSFEQTRNREMAELHPEYAEFLGDVNERIVDLMAIVDEGIYYHPDFRGSASIKQVLPVMVPELSYQGMEVHEGLQASAGWLKLRSGLLSGEERTELLEDMARYCALDTYAMVAILRRFLEMVTPQG
jgi:hypothetical protein